MLRLEVPIGLEGWDEEKEEFVDPITVTLELEHSLASVSKWEQKWHVPFFSKKEKTAEESDDYIKCMTITPNVDPMIYRCLSAENMAAIEAYIGDPMTATTFPNEREEKSKKETITTELIYYWMFSLGIPLEFENRHINQLLTLIRVFNVKNAPEKKMSPKDAIARNKSINARNKALLQSKG